MQKPLIPRSQIHAWVEDIENNKAGHKTALQYLIGRQRPLAKFVNANASLLKVGTKGTVMFTLGAICRLFDLAGGKMAKVSLDRIRDAEERVGGVAVSLLPPDDGFAERLRGVEWRAQPHMLDEFLVDLFDDPEIEATEGAKLFFLMWVVVEVLNEAWTPPADFEGDETYVFSPPAPAEAPADA